MPRTTPLAWDGSRHREGPVTRRGDLDRLYGLLAELRDLLGGYRSLREAHGRLDWPARGVYFFFEEGELREDGRTPRVTRVGTHAVSVGSRTTLWNRLSQHRGTVGGGTPGGGDHRGSIFRLHVGTALLASRPSEFAGAGETWGRGATRGREVAVAELELERAVSRYIGAMPFLWVAADDPPGPSSDRHVIEANIVGLLSNAGRPAIDPASPAWLGHHAARKAIRESGLWNVNFVEVAYAPAALDVLQRHVERMGHG